MMESPWRSHLIQAALTIALTVLTVLSTVAISEYESEEERETQFVVGATRVAEKTATLLYESQVRLEELIYAAQDKPWKELYVDEWRSYRWFRNQWRRSMISHYYEVERYFGPGAANQILHIEEIVKNLPKEDLGSANVCAPAGEYDLLKLADHIDCEVRLLASYNTMVADSETVDALELMGAQRQIDEIIHERMQQYDRATAALISVLNARLDAMGKSQAVFVSEEKDQ